ncbi:MAG: methyltransferase [Pseudomonadota bacterium]|nr:methyltransferase [Pseudomonadota bacterium]
MSKEITKNKFLGGRLKVFQQKHGFRAGHDSVILASAIPAKEGEKCLELGIGCGVVSLCLSQRVKNLKIVGIENNAEVLNLTRRNISMNDMDTNITVIKGNLDRGIEDFPELKRQTFDHVFSNPPYYIENEIVFPLDDSKKNAYTGNKDTLKVWLKIALTFVKSRGSVTFINHIKNFPEMLNIFTTTMGDVKITPIFSNREKPASRVIISGTRDSKKPIKLNNGLVLNNQDGKTPKEVDNILRNGTALNY